MPTSNEIVPNRPLTGIEAKQIILADVHAMLDRDGMFTEYIAFSRLSYEVVVKLHLDNPAYPNHTSVVQSRKEPSKPAVIEPPPLANPRPQPETEIVVAKRRSRVVESPNKERVKRGMPVTVTARSTETGHFEDKQVKYDPESLPDGERNLDEGAKDEDITRQVKKEWEL